MLHVGQMTGFSEFDVLFSHKESDWSCNACLLILFRCPIIMKLFTNDHVQKVMHFLLSVHIGSDFILYFVYLPLTKKY